MYERRSRLNYRQQAELIKFFVAGATARAAGEMAGVNRNTATSYFMRLRRLIASHLPSYRLSGEIEADESYFGGVRKGKRGRGAAGKIAVFGLLKRNGRVYTAIIPDARTETLLPIIKEQVEPDSMSIRIHFQLTMPWISTDSIIIASIIPRSLRNSIIISME